MLPPTAEAYALQGLGFCWVLMMLCWRGPCYSDICICTCTKTTSTHAQEQQIPKHIATRQQAASSAFRASPDPAGLQGAYRASNVAPVMTPSLLDLKLHSCGSLVLQVCSAC